MNPSDNNSFGMPNAAGGQGMMAQPVAPRDTGDILLPGSEKKGGKKWIYALLGVVVVAALAVVGAWMIRGDGGNSSERVAFNEYANYLLYGTESSEDLPDDEYVWGYRYYAQDSDVQFSDDYNKYMNELAAKYRALYDIASSEMGDYDDVFWLFYYTALYPDVSMNEIYAAKRDNMSDADIAARLDDYYAPYFESSKQIVVEYASAKIEELTEGVLESNTTFPDYEIEVFSDIWKMKGVFYD